MDSLRVGTADASVDGVSDRKVVGTPDGLHVGTCDGSLDCATEGVFVGTFDGLKDGCTDGLGEDGADDSIFTGPFVGTVDGCSDGGKDIVGDGANVGTELLLLLLLLPLGDADGLTEVGLELGNADVSKHFEEEPCSANMFCCWGEVGGGAKMFRTCALPLSSAAGMHVSPSQQ